MVGRNTKSWYKVVVILGVLALLAPVLAACGDDDEDTSTQAVSKEPVKIGVLFPYTGANGMWGPYVLDPVLEVAKYVINKRGGVLGGRPVEFVKADSKTEVAGARDAFTKLALRDKVSLVAFGGSIDAEQAASAEMAKEYQIPHFAWRPNLTPNEWRLGVGMPPTGTAERIVVEYVLKQYGTPGKVGFISDQDPAYIARKQMMKEALEKAGARTVYDEQIATNVTDTLPYLTKIKYENPDVLVIASANGQWYGSVFKQIPELGGWGNIKVVSDEMTPMSLGVDQNPAAKGFAFWSTWLAGMNVPGNKEFEEAFQAVLNKPPTDLLAGAAVTFYSILLTAVEAIELAGSDDPKEIRKAALSGKLSWDSPYGRLTVRKDGSIDIPGFMVLVSDGKLVQAPGR